jgi:hypothetical protein
LTTVSQYIWRGFDIGRAYDPKGGDNHVHYQPSLTYALPSGLSANLWASYGLDGNPDVDEVDVTLDYTFAPGRTSASRSGMPTMTSTPRTPTAASSTPVPRG